MTDGVSGSSRSTHDEHILKLFGLHILDVRQIERQRARNHSNHTKQGIADGVGKGLFHSE
jgi:hypothetical protein